jgi:hypothetical protein
MTDDDYLKTADVWTVLDLIVAEWTSDPTSVQCFDLRIVERAKALIDAHRKQAEQSAKDQRQQAFVPFSQAFADYMDVIGFRVVVVGNPRVRGFEGPGLGKFLFEMDFTGGRKRTVDAILIPGDGGLQH